ncbi:MAG: hypothetical protein ACERKR_01675 [Deltaproteobacteria bacterium]|jgi:hypothetical protein
MKMEGGVASKSRVLVLMLSVLLLVGAGCAAWEKSRDTSEETGEKKSEVEAPAPVYYDFVDILIPAELSLVKKSSFVYSTPSFSAGVLVFEGYVQGESLVNFFTTNMPKDGWTLKSSFRYRRVILSFEKEERSCLVSVAEFPLKTRVEIWVAPQVRATMP